jgi:hypothetical protein
MSEGLKLISRCPLCKTSYDPLEAKVLQERDDAHLLHIICRKCANAVLALIFVSNDGVSSVGLVTDCSYDDVLRFRESGEVSIDDVLAVYACAGTNLISELNKA